MNWYLVRIFKDINSFLLFITAIDQNITFNKSIKLILKWNVWVLSFICKNCTKSTIKKKVAFINMINQFSAQRFGVNFFAILIYSYTQVKIFFNLSQNLYIIFLINNLSPLFLLHFNFFELWPKHNVSLCQSNLISFFVNISIHRVVK